MDIEVKALYIFAEQGVNIGGIVGGVIASIIVILIVMLLVILGRKVYPSIKGTETIKFEKSYISYDALYVG